MIPRSRVVAVLLAALFALTACGAHFHSPAAVVNGSPITVSDLEQATPAYKFILGLSRQPCGTAQQGETAQSACSRFVLTDLIQQRVVEAYAKAHAISVTETDITRTIDPLAQQLGGPSQLDARLSTAGTNETAFRSLVRSLLLRQKVSQAVAIATIPDAQLRAAYEKNILQFTQIHAKHILVKTLKVAQQVEKQVTPANFGKLARQYSKDPTSAKNGGDLGTVPASQFVPAFAKAAVALEPGHISAPIKSRFGWHIILLVSKQVTPFEQARSQLVSQAGGAAAFHRWLQTQYANADVEVNPRYGRFDASTGEVVPAGVASPTATGSASAAPTAS